MITRANGSQVGRRLAALATGLLLVAAMFPLMAGAEVVLEPIGQDCVKLDEVDRIVPADFPIIIGVGPVTVTITNMTEKAGEEGKDEYVAFDYVVAGLGKVRTVTYVIKGGNDQQSGSLAAQGRVVFDSHSAISHITFCVETVPSEPTTTTVPVVTTVPSEPTTTTVPVVTTVPSESTTTTTPPTSTTVGPTTTTVPVVTTTVPSDPTTTTVQIAPATTETTTPATLPFTGAGSDSMMMVAVLSLVGGSGLVLLARGSEESRQDEPR